MTGNRDASARTPPAAEVELLARAFTEALSACGVPPTLFSDRSDGTAQRESFRRYLHSTLDPIAKLISAELSTKLETEVDVDLSAIHAADVQGRARGRGAPSPARTAVHDARGRGAARGAGGRRMKGICLTPGCGKAHHANGLCHRCDTRAYRARNRPPRADRGGLNPDQLRRLG